MFTAESDSERILIIGQHLLKLWTIKYRVVFLQNTVYVSRDSKGAPALRTLITVTLFVTSGELFGTMEFTETA